MKTNQLKTVKVTTRIASGMRFAAVTSLVLVLSACGSKQVRNPDAVRVQSDLIALQADRNLATQSPISMQEAEKAVQVALVPERDNVLSAHRVYLADRKVQTARSLAQAQYAVEQRKVLSQQSNEIRLNARTREADAAKREADARTLEALAATNEANAARNQASSAMNEANMAKSEAEAQAMAAGTARSEAEMARTEAENAKSAADMARIDAQIAKDQADAAMNEATIAKGETNAALDAADAAMRKNAELMAQLTDRHILIEGFTDNVGSDASNMVLSQNRANTVSSYLTKHGVPASRISATGKGESLPVAGNENPAGRQLNRRVEVTIENAPK